MKECTRNTADDDESWQSVHHETFYPVHIPSSRLKVKGGAHLRMLFNDFSGLKELKTKVVYGRVVYNTSLKHF